MPEELEIPVAYCATCDERGPVVVKSFPMNEDSPAPGQELTVIYCPGCEQLINLEKDVKIEWYTQEELIKATGWRLVDGK